MKKIFIGSLSVIILIQITTENDGANSYHCGKPLIGSTKNPQIKDSSFTASETDFWNRKASAARFGNNNGWGPYVTSMFDLEYLQVDLEKIYLICGFEVIGCKQSFVERYRVHISPEENFLDSWNMIKPDFTGNRIQRVYSDTKRRELGRYVRLFPYGFNQWTTPCLQLEIYGKDYLVTQQEVFVLEDSKQMLYKRRDILTVKGNDIKVRDFARPSETIFYDARIYIQVVPHRVPKLEELTADTCVIAPGDTNKVYLSGRIDKVNLKTNDYVIEYLKDSTTSTFKREQLQVVFGAWCKKSSQFLRVDSHLCRGEIVQLDSMIVFRSKAGSGLLRLPYSSKQEDYVSNSKVDHANLVKGTSKLLYEDQRHCLKPATFTNYDPKAEVFNLGANLRKKAHQVYYADSSPGFKGCDKKEKMCWNSRIPFMVTRLNCSVGMIWNGQDCVDENECETGMASCEFPAKCRNTERSYECYCPHGTIGDHATSHIVFCSDVNECHRKVCDKNSVKCTNTIGSFKCHCKEGFENSTPDSCRDIDECADPENCRKYQNTVCKNAPGSFSCLCKHGYRDNQNSHKECKDVDECSSKVNKCSPHAHCINSVGSYNCSCRTGFTGDGQDCQDVLECNDPTIRRKCHSSHGQCVDFPGGYKCECKVGYVRVGNGLKSCELADECELGIHKCHKWATCSNTKESYDCGCNNGFEGDGFSCEDVDECTNNQADCGSRKDGIECVNTNGSFKCVCREGFTGDGKKCANIDECKTGAHTCVKHAICTDNEGSFSCACKKGFSGNPRTKCNPKTECMKKLPHCDLSARAVCKTTTNDGKKFHSCVCESGFTGSSNNCTDIDECSTGGRNNCSKNAECINNPGSYECRCKNGFSGNGFRCSDIDECTKAPKCPKNALCSNTKGSFECRCKDGFNGTDPYKRCTDVNECLLGACGYSGHTCQNTFGSFKCKCAQGYHETDYATLADMCEDIDECKTLEKPCGSYNYLGCVNMPGDYICACDQGYFFNKKTKSCEDTDECDAEQFPCAEQAHCVNNEGDFECVCPEGYEGHGKDYCSPNSSPSIMVERISILFAAMTTSLITAFLKFN